MKIFESDDHKLILGDVLEVLGSKIPDNSIDLIFADPPYNIGKDFKGFKDNWEFENDYLEWSYSWLNLCVKKLKHNGSLYLMASTQSMPYFDLYLRDRLTILSRIVWYYDSSGVQAKKFYGSLYEPILYCVKDKRNYTFNSSDILVEAKTGSVRKLIDYRKATPSVYNSKKVPGNVWEFPRVRYRMPEYQEHPTQKPTSLLERIIKASSNEGDVVLDIFSGTFTTSFVAKHLNRKSIGIELQEKYLQIGLRRLQITPDESEEALMSEVNSGELSPQQLTLNLQL
jgi:site-specific DNA-methyltransferase (adenine-specific)